MNQHLIASPSSPGKTTESAVYGYVQRPEIVEFRGQYFYGQNPVQAESNLVPAASYIGGPGGGHGYGGRTRIKGSGGLGPGGLLLATLPLVLAPMLSYLFTPMIIPVTATIAAGRRRRRREANLTEEEDHLSDDFKDAESRMNLDELIGLKSEDAINGPISREDSHSEAAWSSFDKLEPKLKELQVVADYLRKVHFDEKDRDKAMANYLQCDGMLDANDHCLERLACEFSDPRSYNAPELDRAVTSILLGHILNNAFIPNVFKKSLKLAAVHGRDTSGQCTKYACIKVGSTS